MITVPLDATTDIPDNSVIEVNRHGVGTVSVAAEGAVSLRRRAA